MERDNGGVRVGNTSKRELKCTKEAREIEIINSRKGKLQVRLGGFWRVIKITLELIL